MHLVRSLNLGGVNKALVANLGAMRGGEFDHVVCAITPNLTLADAYVDMGVPVFSLGHEGLSTTVRTLLRLRRLVRDRGATVIHSHLGLANFYASVVARICGLGCVATLHNTDVWRETESKPRNASRLPTGWLERESNHRGIDRFVAVSEAVRDAHVATGRVPAARVTVIYNGVDQSAFRDPPRHRVEAERAQLGLDASTHVLLTVGRLVPQKNQAFLVPVMRSVLETNPDTVLLIAGAGGLHAALQEAVSEAGLDGQIRLLGQRSDVPTLLHMSDIVLIPSRNEGFSMAVVEAMAAGQAIVGTAIPPVVEAIRDGVDGLLVVSEDPQVFAASVLDLLDSPDRAIAMGASARRRAAEVFAVERTAAALTEVYSSLAATTR